MRYRFDLTGRVFGRWTVVAFACNRKSGSHWKCRCECGVERVCSGQHLRNGKSLSCGCLRREMQIGRANYVTHGMSKAPEYGVWAQMLERCCNQKCRGYENYGGRGISVCRQWHKFEQFYADMGPRPSGEHSIDRIDNDGNYEPANCRWATRQEQMNNCRRNRRVTIDGVTLTMSQWIRRRGLSTDTVYHRMACGMNPEEALSYKRCPRFTLSPKRKPRPRSVPHPVGENVPFSKLTDDKVREIRRLRKSGVKVGDLASQFRVGYSTIEDVIYNKRWKHVTA